MPRSATLCWQIAISLSALALLSVRPARCDTPVAAQNLWPGPGMQVIKICSDGEGGRWVAAQQQRVSDLDSYLPDAEGLALVVVRRDAVGKELARFEVTSKEVTFPPRPQVTTTGLIQLRDAAPTASGGLVLTGAANASDFPVTRRIGALTPPERHFGFIMKLDRLAKLEWSVAFDGAGTAPFGRWNGSRGSAVALDRAGNVFVTGLTSPSDFPVTQGAYQSSARGDYGDVVVMKVTATGDVVYVSRFGGPSSRCLPFGNCRGNEGFALVVDDTGRAVVGGRAEAPAFPTSADAFQRVHRGRGGAANGFVARLSATGSQLEWSTLIGGAFVATPANNMPSIEGNGDEVRGIGLGADGDVWIAGTSYTREFPTTEGAVQPATSDHIGDPDRTAQELFLARLDARGSRLRFATLLGSRGRDDWGGFVLDPDGSAWIARILREVEYAIYTEAPGKTILSKISGDGRRIMDQYELPEGSAGKGLWWEPGSVLMTWGRSAGTLALPVADVFAPSLYGVSNYARIRTQGVVSPGELIYVLGARLAAESAAASPDSSGIFPSELLGVQVLFDGVPAPLLRVSPERVLTISPFRLAEQKETLVVVRTPDGTTLPLRFGVVAANPQIIPRTDGRAVAFSARGEIGREQGALAGEVISLLITGAGDLSDRPPDGAVATNTQTRPVLPARFRPERPETYQSPWPEIVYFGPAVGLVEGIMQLNIRMFCGGVSGDLHSPWVLEVGEFASPGVEVWVRTNLDMSPFCQ